MAHQKTFVWSGRGQAPLEPGDWVKVIDPERAESEIVTGSYVKITGVIPPTKYTDGGYFANRPDAYSQTYFWRDELFGPLQQHEIPASLRDKD
jgi:hypothetical protein